VVGRGHLIADLSVEEFVRQASKNVVRVRTPQAAALREEIMGPDVSVTATDDGALEVRGLTAEQIGEAAARRAIVLHELTPERASLEEAFMDVTRDSVEFHAVTDGPRAIDEVPA
jgi:ABC-2 type transport system ATP-binding protein